MCNIEVGPKALDRGPRPHPSIPAASAESIDLVALMHRIVDLGKGIYLPHVLVDELKAIAQGLGRSSDDGAVPALGAASGASGSPRLAACLDVLQESDLWQLLLTTQEVVVLPPRVALALRPAIGEWRWPPTALLLLRACPLAG